MREQKLRLVMGSPKSSAQARSRVSGSPAQPLALCTPVPSAQMPPHTELVLSRMTYPCYITHSPKLPVAHRFVFFPLTSVYSAAFPTRKPAWCSVYCQPIFKGARIPPFYAADSFGLANTQNLKLSRIYSGSFKCYILKLYGGALRKQFQVCLWKVVLS